MRPCVSNLASGSPAGLASSIAVVGCGDEPSHRGVRGHADVRHPCGLEAAPRAYRLKASNAAPPISTLARAIPNTAGVGVHETKIGLSFGIALFRSLKMPADRSRIAAIMSASASHANEQRGRRGSANDVDHARFGKTKFRAPSGPAPPPISAFAWLDAGSGGLWPRGGRSAGGTGLCGGALPERSGHSPGETDQSIPASKTNRSSASRRNRPEPGALLCRPPTNQAWTTELGRRPMAVCNARWHNSNPPTEISSLAGTTIQPPQKGTIRLKFGQNKRTTYN
jgi:hypothetical protein